MKKALICLILVSALLLTSCITQRGRFEPEPYDSASDIGLTPEPVETYTEGGIKYYPAVFGEGYRVWDIDIDSDTLIIPSQVNGKPVTELFFRGENDYPNIENIILPDSLTSISKNDFNKFPNLKYNLYNNINYLGTEDNPYEYMISSADESLSRLTSHPDTRLVAEYAFDNDNNIEEVYFGDKLEGILGSAFRNCDKIESVDLGNSVKSIGSLAFASCIRLKSIKFPETLEIIEDSAFSGCTLLSVITLPDSLREIGSSAFLNCASIGKLLFGNGLESIGTRAFYKCKGLKSVKFSSSLRKIGRSAFENCPNLSSISIEEGVEELYYDSFSYMGAGNTPFYIGNSDHPRLYLVNSNGIREFEIDKNTQMIARGALTVSANMTSVGVSPENRYLYSSGNCIIQRETGILLCGIGGAVIPADGSVNSIADYAFWRCDTLEAIDIPASVKRIGNSAFGNCKELKEVKLSEGLLEIGEDAFRYSALESITLPNSLTFLGDCAFAATDIISFVLPAAKTTLAYDEFEGCEKLEFIFLHNKVTELEGHPFYECDSLKSVVYPGTLKEFYAIKKNETWVYTNTGFEVNCSDGTINLPAMMIIHE